MFLLSVIVLLMFTIVLRGTTVLPRNRGTIFLRYQYRRLGGTAAAVPAPFRPSEPALCGSCLL